MKPHIKTFKDFNNDGVIGFPDGTPYKGAEEGGVRQFVAIDGSTYNATFSSQDGSFIGYLNDRGEAYSNNEINSSDVLQMKLEQALKYVSSPTSSPSDIPIFESIEDYPYPKKTFTFGGESFSGKFYRTGGTSNGDFKYKRALQFIYIKEFSSAGGYSGSTNSPYTFEIWGDYYMGQAEPVFRISFEKRSEWVRFIQFLHDNYGLDDNSSRFGGSLKPSDVIKL